MRNLTYRILGLLAPAYARTQQETLRILAYHTVPDAVAYERQLQHLTAHYRPVSIDDVLLAIDGYRSLPPRAVLITYDDGDRSVYERALPLHRRYGLPGVLFVITDLIDTDRPFWWKQVEHHCLERGETYAEARQQVGHLKSVPDAERRDFLARINTEFSQPQLTTGELVEMGESGIAIANHTASHPLMNRCTPTQIAEELQRAIGFLTQVPGAYPKIFAYPNGNADRQTEALLTQEGIRLAFLFDHRLTHLNPEHRLHLSRLRANTYDSLPEFRAKLSGLHACIYHRSFAPTTYSHS